MKVVDIPLGSLGADMLTPLTPQVAFALSSFILPGTRSRLTYVMRYLENLTPSELAGILSTGLGVTLVGESPPNGWIPTAIRGSSDGLREVTKARALSIPNGITITCDLEGMGGTSQDTIDYSRAWCDIVQHAQDIAACYVGSGVPLTPTQLFQLPFTRYIHSLSNVQQVAVVDYCVVQLFPTTNLGLPTGALPVDLQVVQQDKRGRLPTMVIENGVD
jgi:hypothetical protein